MMTGQVKHFGRLDEADWLFVEDRVRFSLESCKSLGSSMKSRSIRFKGKA